MYSVHGVKGQFCGLLKKELASLVSASALTEGWSLLYDIKLEQVKAPPRKYRSNFKCTEFSLNNQLKQCKIYHQKKLKTAFSAFCISVCPFSWDK